MTEATAPFDPALVRAIAGDNPVGRDLTYEPEFQALQAEVDKATALAGDAVDWRRVQKDCARLLREETKDLRCASWLALSMAHVEGWSGALSGLELCRELVLTHWDAMYPPAKRTRARVSLVEWLFENLKQALGSRAASEEDGASLRASLVALRALEDALGTKLGDANPGAGPLRSLLREKAAEVPEAPPPAPPPPVAAPVVETASAGAPVAAAPPATAAGAAPSVAPAFVQALAASSPATPPSPADVTDLSQLTSSSREWILAMAQAERASDPTAPRSYRMARVGAWLLVNAPPEVEGARTFVKAPRADDVRQVRALVAEGAWAAARDASEDALQEHIFWLDLHFFTAKALENLGSEFEAARQALIAETVAFLDRAPGLEALCFRDGTPLASAETLAWLEGERSRRSPAGSGGEGGRADDAQPLIAAARAKAGAGDVSEGISEGLEKSQHLPTARSRYRARLGISQIALERGKKRVGLAILEQLLAEVDATLERWEPDLSATTLREWLRASTPQAIDIDPREAERQDLLFRRLVRLDPASALHLEDD